ncbi:MAG: DUF6049 family protein [Actinomycetota bacterium]|nr:DUF6049 family protein [Actinomycetota bacterium]
MSRSLRGRHLAIALAAAVLCGLAAAAGPGAHAEESIAPSVLVAIDSFTPLVPEADGTLTISGRVISTARTELTDVSVTLRRSSTPLLARKDVAAVADSPLAPEGGDPDSVVLPQTLVVVAPVLPPGGRAGFRISLPLADLGLAADGTYVLSVEATGRDAGVDAAPVRKGIVRTFLPWYPDPAAVTPVALVWLWPLADWPSRDAAGVLLDQRTPDAVAEGGRLDRLASVASRFGTTVSWIVDPALLQTVDDMTRGYQVMVDGEITVGDQEEAAAQWLDLVRTATQDPGVRSLPYADIDASSVVRAGMTNDVVRAVTTGPGIAAAALGSTAPGGLYWAPFGRLDRSAANVLASAGVTAMVLSADAMPVTDEAGSGLGEATAALPTSFGAVRAVLADPGLSDILSLPQRSATEVIQARQRFLAETALIASTIPADQSARTVVVAPASLRWDPAASLVSPLLRATRTAPWLAPTTLAQVLDAAASSTSRQRGGYGQKARDAELPAAYMASVARATAMLASFTSIIDDPTGISEPFSAALLRAESAAWRSDLDRGRELVDSITDDLRASMGRVRVLSEGTITFSGDSGRVPVTIANDLDRSVTVGLALVGRPSLRLVSDPLTGITIEAGKMASVDISARVVGGDPLPVEVQLLDADQAAYGRPAEITLASTAYARAAAWVVALAFVAILVFVVVGVTRRIRKARAGRPRPDLGP